MPVKNYHLNVPYLIKYCNSAHSKAACNESRKNQYVPVSCYVQSYTISKQAKEIKPLRTLRIACTCTLYKRVYITLVISGYSIP